MKKQKNRKKKKEIVKLYPILPTKYSRAQREELKKFEAELLKGRKINLDSKPTRRFSKAEKESLKKFEAELFKDYLEYLKIIHLCS